MYCSKCGKELLDEAVICPNCGCPTQNYKNAVEDKTSIWLCLLSVVIPVAGVVLGIVYLCGGKKASGKNYLLCAVASRLLFILFAIIIGSIAHGV